jgi:GNAT superfamily N-acetyltransferase
MDHTLNHIRIRDARDDERAAIRELTLAGYAEYATIMTPSAWAGLEQSLLMALAGDVTAERIVAEHDNTLVGSVMLCPPAPGAYGGALASIDWPEVRLLAVALAARGQGVGTALMHECMRRARRAGATALGLHTSDSLRVAVQMYERMGFVRVPEYDFQPSGAELVKAYRRSLTGASDEFGYL